MGHQAGDRVKARVRDCGHQSPTVAMPLMPATLAKHLTEDSDRNFHLFHAAERNAAVRVFPGWKIPAYSDFPFHAFLAESASRCAQIDK